MNIRDLEIEECRDVLVRTQLGRLACSHEGQPYIVPFYFGYDGYKYIYAFSTIGKKIEWMRANPLVCIEVDDIKGQNDWRSIIISGRYEELPDTPEFEAKRVFAHELLSKHPMWWQPALSAGRHRGRTAEKSIYFRILVESISGRRNKVVEERDGAKPLKSKTGGLGGFLRRKRIDIVANRNVRIARDSR
jgi:nitroimidazol reductase NimA-like FMN-containing flavoprotein (pyridoxamine 5'-phosphate oxidase superfamily)